VDAIGFSCRERKGSHPCQSQSATVNRHSHRSLDGIPPPQQRWMDINRFTDDLSRCEPTGSLLIRDGIKMNNAKFRSVPFFSANIEGDESFYVYQYFVFIVLCLFCGLSNCLLYFYKICPDNILACGNIDFHLEYYAGRSFPIKEIFFGSVFVNSFFLYAASYFILASLKAKNYETLRKYLGRVLTFCFLVAMGSVFFYLLNPSLNKHYFLSPNSIWRISESGARIEFIIFWSMLLSAYKLVSRLVVCCWVVYYFARLVASNFSISGLLSCKYRLLRGVKNMVFPFSIAVYCALEPVPNAG
jgi:hypothetical protein